MLDDTENLFDDDGRTKEEIQEAIDAREAANRKLELTMVSSSLLLCK